MHTQQDWRNAELHLLEPDAYLDTVARLYEAGARSFLMWPRDLVLAERLASRYGTSINLYQEVGPEAHIDAVIVPPTDVDRVDEALHRCIDLPLPIVAPITERHISRRSLFVLSIPKSGTHFIFHLLDSFGVTPGLGYKETFAPNTYYFLGHDHSHITATEFFDHLWNQPRGGGDHPFFEKPALFVYRNPMDVIVSEVFYYIKHEKTALAYYYEDLKPEEIALRLIEGDPLTRSIRDRLMMQSPWLRLKNVIPVCYEEFVGARGGGTAESQAKAIWSLQLKLQVPGSPLVHGERTYTDKSATFRKGRIHGHKSFFRPEHTEAFRRLRQDFMSAFGYALDDPFVDGYLPRFVDEFRQRRLRLGRARG